MTVLSHGGPDYNVQEWLDLGATYTVLEDIGRNKSNEWEIFDSPTFVVLDRDMTILYRGSNQPGFEGAVSLADKLLLAE
jgi:hypothetical protein